MQKRYLIDSPYPRSTKNQLHSVSCRVLITESREVERFAKKTDTSISGLMLLAADLLCVRGAFTPIYVEPLPRGSSAYGEEIVSLGTRVWRSHFYGIVDLIRESDDPTRSMASVFRYELLSLVRQLSVAEVSARFTDISPDPPPKPKNIFSIYSLHEEL